MFQMKHLPSSVVQWEIKWNFAINYCTTDNGWCFIWNKFWLENKLHKYCLVHQTNNNNSIKIIYNNHNHRASSVPIFPIFPIFCNFPYIFLFNSKTPYNPYNVRIKRKISIFLESCKTDSAQLAFLLSMELIFFQSELGRLLIYCAIKCASYWNRWWVASWRAKFLKRLRGSTCLQ